MYFLDLKEYDLRNFNFPHILDKQIPGCGFTEYCLNCNLNVVLCSPRKMLLENKYEQHYEDIYYFQSILEVENKYDQDISGNKPIIPKKIVSLNKYTPEEKYLFYVSVTRAQHKLIVFNQGDEND